MFCTVCGASNPEDARFCNQCGGRVVLDADGKPTTLSGVGDAPAPSSMQGRPPSLQGASLDGATVPMHGLSRGRVAAIAASTGVVCLALGAVIAHREPKAAETVPVTPVGLIGSPAAVVPVRTTEATPAAPQRAGSNTRPRSGTTTRPANTGSANTGSANAGSANAGSANAGSANTGSANTGSANTGSANAGSANTGSANAGSANTGSANAGSTNTGSANTGSTNTGSANAGSAPQQPDENGVIERGPRVSSGGYHLGEETDAEGTMDPRVFTYVYNHYRTQIAACYSSASRAREVSGVIVLRVRINGEGRVSSTRVISDSARVPELAQCVQNAVRGWRYPQPEGGDVEVEYPMRFGSAS